MKMAKTFVALLTLVLVVICFNTPALASSGDDHPWDNDGGGIIDGDGVKGTPKAKKDPTIKIGSSEDNSSSNTYNLISASLEVMFNLMIVINYQQLPDYRVNVPVNYCD